MLDPLATEGPGSVLGNYRLIEAIGEGGFGVVWRAEQSEPVRRQVALKLIKLGMDTRQVVARFEAERQALALMDHPSIARVYDAGATETGRPYFVMELVDGEPLTEYCGRRKLGTRARLELFRDTCLAVQHAHQKGILHRDLKPSNVLVTEVDGAPVPKVIDFGIAKAMQRPLTDSSLATEQFQVMGTPEYMSPEQAAGRDVDTRADVYALGTMLYELLTGELPFRVGEDGLTEIEEVLRYIREVTPAKPSTRVTGAARDASPDGLARTLRGDLDWIVMKALEKERDRRYATVVELAEDIARHLRDEPVLASPPSKRYRLRKFVRRNRLAVGSAAVVSTTLVVATVGLGVLYTRAVSSEERATREAERATREAARATREAETSRQALGFMTGMFEMSDPGQARGESVTAREILDRGAERIEVELGSQPEVRSTLMATMGNVYRGLGLYDRAEELLLEAAGARRELSGDDDPGVLELANALAGVWGRQARYAEAEELLRDTLARQMRVPGQEHIGTIDSRVMLSQVLEKRSRYDEAEALAREALEAGERVLGEDHELTLAAVLQLGVVLRASGRFEEAEEQFLRGLHGYRRKLGDDHPETLVALGNVAWVYMDMGRYDDAEELFLEAQETVRRVFGDEHLDFLKYRSNLGLLYREQGRLAEAEAIYREVLEAERRTLGEDHVDTLLAANTLGAVLYEEGRLEEAEALYREALDGLRRELGEHNEHTLSSYGNMAVLCLTAGRLEEAEDYGRIAHEGSVALHGEDHPTTLLRLENLGNVLYTRGDKAGVVQMLDEVLAGRRRTLGDDHPAVARTLVNLAVVHDSLGDPEAATAFREELLERARQSPGFEPASAATEIEKLGRTRVGAEEYGRALDCILEVLRIRLRVLGPAHPDTLISMREALELALRSGRWSEVAPSGSEYHAAHVAALGEKHPDTRRCVELLLEGSEQAEDVEQAETWWEVLESLGG